MKPMGGGMLENATVAFQYLRQLPGAIPVVGIERVSEMAEIVALYKRPPELTGAERQEMERVRQELGQVFCRRCDYCQPCPEGIPISTVMNAPTLLKRMPPERVFGSGWIKSAVESLDRCQDCGECESRCPYELSIRQRMAEVAGIYQQAEQEYLASVQ